jgi:hypothetical protein
MSILHIAGCGCPRAAGLRRLSIDLASRQLRYDYHISLEDAVSDLAGVIGWPAARHAADKVYPRIMLPLWLGRLAAVLVVLSGPTLFAAMRPEWSILPIWMAAWGLPLWFGARIASRRRNVLRQDGNETRVLRLLGSASGVRLVRRHFQDLSPATMVHPYSAMVVARARNLDQDTTETASGLAHDYHGSLPELLRTAAML